MPRTSKQNKSDKALSIVEPHLAEKDPPKKKSAKQEKRLRRFRSKCPVAIQQRIDRAVTQRLYLVERSAVDRSILSCDFVVLGSTGNVYNVKIARTASCSCPDHARGNLCKHILFVLLKVMGLPRDSMLVYQAAWLTSEVETMFVSLENRQTGGSVMANKKVRSMYAKMKAGDDCDDEADDSDDGGIKRQVVEADSDCPICFDSLFGCKEGLTFCRAQCGANFHEKCIAMWSKSKRHGQVTCPNCRQPWEDKTMQSPNKKEGYVNLGQAQGQSSRRDTSTYYNYKRQRYY